MSAAIQLQIFDATSPHLTLGKPVFTLLFDTDITTARALIARRVEAELQRVAAHHSDKYFHGLIQPTKVEVRANGYDSPKADKLNLERQIINAITAFESNKFLLLVNDRQILDLDEEIRVADSTTVTFLRLVPLAGG